jgi:hypothetical protein
MAGENTFPQYDSEYLSQILVEVYAGILYLKKPRLIMGGTIILWTV